MKTPYKNFDLPKQHLIGEHYVPARARHTDEIDRRRSLPRGTVLLEQQQRGLAIVGHVLDHVEDEADVRFATEMAAISGLNAGWYSYGQQAPVMRRRLELPELADDTYDWRETRVGLMIKVREGLAHASELATVLTQATPEHRSFKRYTFNFGKQIGNVSLKLANVGLGNAPLSMNAFDVQSAVREESLVVLDRARTIAGTIGINPSIAQLADPDSPLAVYWRRSAPNGAFEAFEQATEEVRHAA